MILCQVYNNHIRGFMRHHTNYQLSMILCTCSVLLNSCGGRVIQPIETTRTIDPMLSCAHIAAELDNNGKRAKELLGERKDQGVNNLGFLITSPLFLDFSDTEKKEIKALAERNIHLADLQKLRSCVELDAGAKLNPAVPIQTAPTK